MFGGASRWRPQIVIRYQRGTSVMATKTIPANAGQFRVETARAGNLIVINDRTGKNRVIIPVRSQAQADELCVRLNAGDHNGQVSVPNNVR